MKVKALFLNRSFVFTFLFSLSGAPFSADLNSQFTASSFLAQAESSDLEMNKKILVELFLSPEQKENIGAIEKEFEAVSITKIKTQFFRLGHPPTNIAIGRNVPASTARLAMELAITYNRGIKFLLPEERLAHDYVAIGTSIFDEIIQKPVSQDDVKQLLNPALSTGEFHALYRKLTGEDQRSQS